MYIIKFKDIDCWIADWDGDPGRTIVKENAKTFKTKAAAKAEIKIVKRNNNHRKMDLELEEI